VTCALGVVLAAPPASHAFIVLKNWNGETERWNKSSITWTMSTSVMDDVPFAALQGALASAFASWDAVACANVALTYGGQKANDPQSGIHITFRQNGWDPSVADALAYSVSETQSNGTITSNDIVFNAYDVSWSTSVPAAAGKSDIQAVVAHEIGHALGLDHAREFEATMFFSGGGTDARTLEPDDTRGLCFLYPTTTFTSGQACDACDANANCAGGVCLDWGGGHAYCGRNCGGANGPCPEGFGCYQLQGVTTPQCLPEMDFCHDYGGAVALGDRCFGHSQCASGLCLVLEEEAYCSKECNAANPGSCGAGFACVEPGICLKAGSKPYGADCQDSGECQSAECVFFQFGTGVCTQGCGSQGGGGSCPGGNRCYQDLVCVPPGTWGNGTPCYAPDQCRGMYCEADKCTETCGAGRPCPGGTTCSGGFCEGAEVGAPCTLTGQCPSGLTCQKPTAESAGTCERQCDAFTDRGCGDGEVCRWLWLGWASTVVGRCTPENGGAGVEASCADIYCEADLVCRFRDDLGGPICHRDCRVGSSHYGCDFDELCRSLEDADDPQHGICVPKAPVGPDPGPEPSPEPTGDDVATGDDTSGASDVSGPTEPVDSGGGGPEAVGRSAGGCGGARGDGGAGALGLGLGLVTLLLGRRARRRAA